MGAGSEQEYFGPPPGWGMMQPGMYGYSPAGYGYNPYYGPAAPMYNYSMQNVGAGVPQIGGSGMLGQFIQMQLMGGIPGTFANRMMLGNGMVPGPMAGSASRFYTGMRQMRDMREMAGKSTAQDQAKWEPLVQRWVAAKGYKGDELKAITNDVSGLIAGGINNPMAQQVMQMFGLDEDMLAPGGLSQSFSSRMYMAGMGAKTGPGDGQQLSTKDVDAISVELKRRMGEGRKFTRGSTTKDFGEIAIGMAERGLMQFGQSPEQTVEKMSEMNQTLRAMADMMGTPDAPMRQMFVELEKIFGAGLKTISPAKMKQMVQEADALAQTIGMTPDMMNNYLGASVAIGTGRYGLAAATATRLSMDALYATAGAGQAGPGPLKAGEVDTSRLSNQQIDELVRTTQYEAGTSKFAKRATAMQHVMNMRGGKLGKGDAEMEILQAKISSGTETEQDRLRYREIMSGPKYYEIMARAGRDYRAVTDIEESEIVQDMMNQTQIGATGLRMANVGLRENLLKNFIAGDFSALESKMGGKKLDVANMLDYLRAGKGDELTPTGARKRVGKYITEKLGLSLSDEDLANVSDITFNRIQARSRDVNIIDGKRISFTVGEQFSGQAAQEATARIKTEALGVKAFNEIYNTVTGGGGKGGLSDVVQRAIAAFGSTPGMDIEKTLAQAVGGVTPEEKKEVQDRMKAAMQSAGTAQEEITRLTAERAKVADGSPEAEAIDKQINDMHAQIKTTFDRLDGIRPILEKAEKFQKDEQEKKAADATKNPEPTAGGDKKAADGKPVNGGVGETTVVAQVSGSTLTRAQTWDIKIRDSGYVT